MPQFDFYTAFNQIFYGFLGFLTLFLLLVLPGSTFSSFLRLRHFVCDSIVSILPQSSFKNWLEQVWQKWHWLSSPVVEKSLGNGSLIPSYLESFHVLFLARKIKFYSINRIVFFISTCYTSFLKDFVFFSNRIFISFVEAIRILHNLAHLSVDFCLSWFSSNVFPFFSINLLNNFNKVFFQFQTVGFYPYTRFWVTEHKLSVFKSFLGNKHRLLVSGKPTPKWVV